jgi:quercetin dioxygenase-like cupin family protein
MPVRELFFSFLATLFLGSTALAQGTETKRPFLIVDTQKVEPSATYTTQNMKFIASSPDTGGVTTVFESIEMPGYKTNWHRHNNAEESFYVLEGVLTVTLGDTTYHMGPGSYVFIARGTPHAQGNLGDTAVRFITTVTPGGIEEFFRDRSELLKTAKPGDADFDLRYRPILQKHEKWLEILGPWTPEKP